jgi:hypothetical protein
MVFVRLCNKRLLWYKFVKPGNLYSMSIDWTNVSVWVTILTGVGGFYMGLKQLWKNHKRARDRQAMSVLQSAKEYDSTIKSELENKIHELELKLNALRESVEKDVAHLKETYKADIGFLGDKIAELRKEVHDRHGELVQLLTKLIGKD